MSSPVLAPGTRCEFTLAEYLELLALRDKAAQKGGELCENIVASLNDMLARAQIGGQQ